MRFNLEIYPSNNFGFYYIKDNQDLKSTTVPLFYNVAETLNLFPSDYISVKENYVPENAFTDTYISFGNGQVGLISDNFVVTNIKKINSSGMGAVPLFYKHVIDSIVDPYQIRVTDYFGIEVNDSEYLIDSNDMSTIIYKNKTNEILFVEYIENNKPKKKLLSLEKAIREITFEDILNDKLDKSYTYKIVENFDGTKTLVMNVDSDAFLSYISEKSVLRPPSGNLGDIWMIDILNIEFENNGNKYKTTDYYLQNFFGFNNSKLVEKCKCKKISKNIIKAQYPISKNFMNNIEVFVYDFLSNELIAAYSSNKNLINIQKDGISYSTLTDANYDGYISIPMELDDTHLVLCTQYTDLDYFTYYGIDLSLTNFSENITIGIYIKPYTGDDDNISIGHSVIGVDFINKETYLSSLATDHYYHLGFISAIPIKERQGSPIPFQRNGNEVQDSTKLQALKSNKDVLLKDIYDNILRLELEDTLVVTSQATLPTNTLDIVKSTIDASTKAILKTGN
jgi:hypothetical protein